MNLTGVTSYPNILPLKGFTSYRYNAKNKSFEESKDWIFYSVPYWDEEETKSAMLTFLIRKWLVPGENIFAEIKRFRIIAEKYRNRKKRFGLRFVIIASIFNKHQQAKMGL